MHLIISDDIQKKTKRCARDLARLTERSCGNPPQSNIQNNSGINSFFAGSRLTKKLQLLSILADGYARRRICAARLRF